MHTKAGCARGRILRLREATMAWWSKRISLSYWTTLKPSSYKFTMSLRCWKEHTCIGCSGAYAYELMRRVEGTGRTAEQAQAAARAAARRTMERDTDLEPCPMCGLYQPDMIAQGRAKVDKAIFCIAFIVFPIILLLRCSDAVQSDIATWTATVACALGALGLCATDLHNPNRDTQANRLLAQQRVTAGSIRSTPGRTNVRVDEGVQPRRSMLELGALCMALAAVVAAAAPELVRSNRHWPLNAEAYPPVVGPGDTTRVYMPQKITSVKGYWDGRASVQLRDPAQPSGHIELPATTNHDSWGSTIYAKSREKSTKSSPWVSFTLPGNPELAGKTVECDLHLDIKYPQLSDSSSWTKQRESMHHLVSLRLGPPDCSASYRTLWWEATAGGMIALLASSLLLLSVAERLRRTAKPTRMYVGQASLPKHPQIVD
jgi:hypothetical protein